MYKVKKRFGTGAETQMDKQFNTEAEAKAFIMEKLREDFDYKLLNTVYGLYEGADKMGEFTQRDLDTSAQDQSSSQQQGSKQSFSPSPFQMGPRPAGIARSGFKEEPDDKKK